MLLRFVASNFLSIAGELEFNMFPYGKIKSHPDHVYKTPQVDLLKAAAIYGANGSGKSNLVKALSYLRKLVVEGEIPADEFPDVNFRLNEEFEDKPTTLELEFKSGKKYFSYGVNLIGHSIREEWLFEISPKTGKQDMVFERKMGGDKIIHLSIHPKYMQNEKERLLVDLYAEEILKEDQSFIYLVRGKKYIEIKEAFQWFDSQLEVLFPTSKFQDLVVQFIEDENFRTFVNKAFEALDTGICGFELQTKSWDLFFDEDDERLRQEILDDLANGQKWVTIETNDGETFVVAGLDEHGKKVIYRIVTLHRGVSDNAVSFEIEHESDGTRRLFDLIPALFILYSKEKVYVGDELDRSLHPALLKKFVSLFLQLDTKGQLIFTTHESNLLDLELFRQDEIWFMEKDKSGASRAYSLSEFMPRYDSDIRKGYLNGRFGAIPFLGNLDDLNWKHAEEEQTV